MLSSFLSLSFSCHPNHLIITINSEFISSCHSPYSFSPSSSPFPFNPTSFPSYMLDQSILFIFTIFHSASLKLNHNNNNFFISSIIYSYSIIYPYVTSPHHKVGDARDNVASCHSSTIQECYNTTIHTA